MCSRANKHNHKSLMINKKHFIGLNLESSTHLLIGKSLCSDSLLDHPRLLLLLLRQRLLLLLLLLTELELQAHLSCEVTQVIPWLLFALRYVLVAC